MDTDILLAVLSSMIEPLVCDQSTLLESLVECDGDAERAAELLRKGAFNSGHQSKKRKRTISLDGWLAGPSSETRTSSKKDAPEPASSRASSKPLSSHVQSFHASKSTSKKPVSEAGRIAAGVSTSRKPVSSETKGMQTTTSSSVSPMKSPSKAKAVTGSEFMELLRPPTSAEATKQPPRFPSLTLTIPAMVAQHTPCTLHLSILPPELACRLFYTMLQSSHDWKRNKWWLFDRVVESPHRTSFYCRRQVQSTSGSDKDMQEAAQFWYNGRQTDPPAHFPPAMEEACSIIERVVNAEMRERLRFPLEWAGDPQQHSKNPNEKVIWQANVAAANCYEGGKESVGPHSDQLTYLGPYPTIASISLGTNRTFRLREVIPTDEREERSARTYNIPLPHNSLLIMHASTQEMFKHSIPPQNVIDLFHPPFPPPLPVDEEDEPAERAPAIESSNARINITFRFYRPDYRAQTTPRCKCGVPCILRPDMKNRYVMQTCAVSDKTKEDVSRKDIVEKYWWTCYAGAQNDGKGCGLWKIMDVVAEGRGPFVGPISKER